MSSRQVHPWVFMVLIIPFGVVSGYVAVTLAYQLKQAGVSVGQVAGLVALSVLPHTWKFFWAPVIDATLDQKKWYLVGGNSLCDRDRGDGILSGDEAGIGGVVGRGLSRQPDHHSRWHVGREPDGARYT